MASTVIRGQQIRNDDVGREDLNVSTTTRAVITKAVAGTGIALSSTGVDAGTGDVTVSFANISANSILGNNTGASAVPIALTQAKVTALLNQFTSSLQGVVPASGGGTSNFLRADGTWATPPGGGGGGGPLFNLNIISVNTNAGSVADTHYIYLVSGATTVTLPTAVGNTSMYTIKRVGTSTVQIATTSSQTIDATTAPISITRQDQSLSIVSDGTNWIIF